MTTIERYKEIFKNHVATLSDYGNIKILDFKNPDSNEHRIRFIFEDDYCRVHISGDLGELIAMNYHNMTYDRFIEFANNPLYDFESKVKCHDRPFVVYDEEQAAQDIRDYLEDNDLIEDVLREKADSFGYDDKMKIEEFIEDVMDSFDCDRGVSLDGACVISKIDDSVWQTDWEQFGKKKTDIIDIYMLAFRLAKVQIDAKGVQ